MAWTAPRTWVSGELVTAALFNTHLRDDLLSLETGRLAIASQAADDIPYASSSTQLARSALFNFDGTKLGVGVSSPAFEPFTAISSASDAQATICSTHASYTGSALKVGAVRAANTAYDLIHTATGTSADGSSGTASFVVRGDGQTAVAGNVVVGATEAKATHHIKAPSNNWEDGLLLEHDSGDTGWDLHPENNGENALFIGYNANTAASLAGQSATAVMNLTSAGNVGVGTTVPGTAVAATGMIHSVNCVRAWARVKVQTAGTPGTPDLIDSFNVASLTDNGVGLTTITFTTALPHADYVVLVTFDDDYPKVACIQSAVAASFQVRTFNSDFTTLADLDWYVAIISD
mgnify:CR=1 FL=1|tara:strand:- start:1696 stop:2739 length:1044 start_codon:yes stop_codon:yes gene_type:complete